MPTIQVYRVPVFTTGCTSDSPHRTDHEVADHGGPAVIVELHHLFFGQFLQRHIDHADGTMDDFLPRRYDRLRLLAAQHGLGNLRRVGQMRQPRAFSAQSG